MTYSLNTLSNNELNALNTYNERTEVIALDLKDGSKFVKVSRDDCNCWQRFLSLFNCGALADKEIGLRDVAAKLSQYRWEEAAQENQPHYSTYLKVCNLAGKALLYRNTSALFNRVSAQEVEKSVDFTQRLSPHYLAPTTQASMKPKIKWNPALQVKHLRHLLEKSVVYSRATIRDELGCPLQENVPLSFEDLKKSHLSLVQNIYPSTPSHNRY